MVRERDCLKKEIEEHNRLLTPFRRLPDDMLREIFLACLPDAHNATMSRREAPILLGRVCSRWRTVVYATPRLWATLHVPLPLPNRRSSSSPDITSRRTIAYHERLAIHHAAVKSWLARSGTCGLSLSFHPNSGYSPEHDLVVRDYLNTLLSFSDRWYNIEMTIPYGQLSEAILSIAPTSVPMLQHVSLKFPHSVPPERAPRWAMNGLITASRLRSADLVMFPTSPSAVACSWARITYLCLSDMHPFSHSNRRGSTIHEAHAILSACRSLEHCELDIFDAPDAVSPPGPIALPRLRSLAVVEACASLTTLFECFLDLPELRAVSYQTGLWPTHARPSALIALLAHTQGRVAYLSTNLRYYTHADLGAVFGYLPHLTHLSDEGCRLSNTREQVIGRTQNLPVAFNVKKVVLGLLSPRVPPRDGEETPLPHLRTLSIKESADVSETDVLSFLTARMEAGAVPGSTTESLRELRIAFSRPARLDLRTLLLPHTEEAGGPLKLNISYRTRRPPSEREFHPHGGLVRRKTSVLIKAAYDT